MELEPSLPTIDPDEILRRALRRRIPGMRLKREPEYPALPPAEEKSVLSEVLGKGIGGLQYLGETLDKPGRAIRGLMAGKPSELANLIPFSDTLGITDPAQSVGGRDLLEKAGVLGKNTPGLDWGDVAGFGAEVLTDPLSYLTLGGSAIGKAGNIANAVGISTKGANRFKTLGEHLATASPDIVKAAEAAAVKQGTTLAELSGQKLGGAFGLTTGPLGLLGVHGKSVPGFAQSEAARKTLKGVGNAVSRIPGVEGLNRGRKALFDYRVKGQVSKAGQALAEAQTHAAEAGRPAAVTNWAKFSRDLEGIRNSYAETFGADNIPIPENLSQAVEKVARMQAEGVKPTLAFAYHELPYHPETAKAIQDAVGEFGAAKDDLWNHFLQMGGDSASLHETEALKHAPRYPTPKGEQALQGAAYKGTPDSAKARLLPTKYLPADVINAIYKDPDVAQWTKQLSSKTFSVLGSVRQADAAHLFKGWSAQNPVGPEGLSELLLSKYGHFLQNAAVAEGIGPGDVAKELAAHLTSRNKGVQFFTKSGNDLYGQFTHDAYKYMTEVARKNGDMSAIHETLARSLVPGGVPLESVFKDAGMNGNAAMQFFTQKFGPLSQGMGVDPEVANAVLSVTKKSQSPEWLTAMVKGVPGKWIGIDGLTQMFKRGVTLPFPNFAVRNFYSGQAMNAFSNEIPDIRHLGSYMGEVLEARRMLADPAKHAGLIDELAAHGVYSENDLASLGTELGWSMQRTPNPIGLRGLGRDFAAGRAQAVSQSGNRFTAALRTPAEIGAQVNRQVEWMNRVPMYLYLRNKLGYTAEQAARRVRELQVDYGAFSPFEKSVMSRLVPFYKWQRAVVPEMLRQIAERPGGVTAQTVRASNIGRSEDEFVPPYVGEGMSVNLGGDKYLSGLGLPTDQFGDLFARGPTALGTISRTGQKALAQTNPLLKAPLELATGKNFFTGRDLADSYRFPTDSVLVNEGIYNTPAARAVTSTRQLFDPRKSKLAKGVNLLTGARITDVSGGLEKQQRIAESKMLSEMLREYPQIRSSTDVYVGRDRDTGEHLPLPPQAEKLFRAYSGLKRRQEAEARKRKKKGPKPLAAQAPE